MYDCVSDILCVNQKKKISKYKYKCIVYSWQMVILMLMYGNSMSKQTHMQLSLQKFTGFHFHSFPSEFLSWTKILIMIRYEHDLRY